MNELSLLEPELLDKVTNNFSFLVDSADTTVKKTLTDILKNSGSLEKAGQTFEGSLEKSEKKDKGQYYTPKSIVEYIISRLSITANSTVLDPTCGCGSFLLTLFDKFNDKFGPQFLKNIYGVDINEDAVVMTRASLYARSQFNDTYLHTIKQNILTGNSLVSKGYCYEKSFNWYTRFQPIMQKGGFDFIIGNPPYVTLHKHKDFDPSESVYKDIIDGPTNAATLMIGRSLELLKEGGVLAFLLPKSILYVDSYANLRKYLILHSEIMQLFDLGSKFKGVRGEQFVLIARKKQNPLDKDVKVRTFKYPERKLSEQPYIFLSKRKLISSSKFLTLDRLEYYNLINKLSKNSTTLNEFVNGKISRGLPIGGNHTTPTGKLHDHTKVIRGRDIAKFKIKPLNLINNVLMKKQSAKRIKNLKKNNKVILQNIFSCEAGAISAYDEKGIITLDTVTNIIVKNDTIGKYIVALLSSKLINFYLIYGIFNRSKLTMHMDKSYIGTIPVIAKLDSRKLKQLVGLVNTLANLQDLMAQKKLNREIDDLVYNIYGIKNTEINLIEKAVSCFISKKSLW